jgi:hypothetical protein
MESCLMPELAYIDPGSGSLIVQAAIAAIVAVPVFFRHQIGRALAAVRGRDANEPRSPGANDRIRYH